MTSHSNAVKPAPVFQARSRQSANVLIIDDDPLARETLTRVVAALGIDAAVEAGSGTEAIALLSRSVDHFDLIFCDLQMPNGDGLDVVQACASLGVRARIVLMSGAGENVLSEAARLARTNGYAVASTMAKPFSMADVGSVLSRVDKFGTKFRSEQILPAVAR